MFSSENEEKPDQTDFPSGATLFATNRCPEQCLEDLSDDPDQTPIKMFPYIGRIQKLRDRNTKKDLQLVAAYIRLIPQLDRFYERFDNLIDDNARKRVLAHAQNIFLAHLSSVKSQSDNLASSKGYSITRVAATIPPNWDQWTQEFYIKLLGRAWNNLNIDAFSLIYESEAVGHWLLSLEQPIEADRPKRLVIVDFGGHTLVSDKSRQPSMGSLTAINQSPCRALILLR